MAAEACATPAKEYSFWGVPHIISFEQVRTDKNQADTDKNQARSFFGDGDFSLVRSSTVQIHGRGFGG